MSYNCVVCIKQVPDTKNISGEAMKKDGTVNRASLPAIFNPEDLHALETALQIKDMYGGTVTVLTMGLPKACDILRESLYRGADKAILLTDRKAAGSDTLATSYILSCAIKKLDADIVLCGRQAIDGDTAQVGPQCAEKLDCTLITYLEELVNIQDDTIRVKRNIGQGWEIVEANLPVLITVMDTANVPRPPAAKRMGKYKRAMAEAEVEQGVANLMHDKSDNKKADEVQKRLDELKNQGLLIDQWSLDDVEADMEWCGLTGSPTKVNRIQSIILSGRDHKQIPPTDEGITEMIGELIEEHTIG